MDSNQPTAMMDNLRRLCVIRLIVLVSMLLALSIANAMESALPYRPITITLALLATLTLFSWLRTRATWPLTDIEFLLQLLADILGIGIVLYFSGGATNPFVSYFLVPLCIAAATLPWRLIWLVALLSISIYTLLLFFHHPLQVLAVHGHDAPLFNPHVLGMWANFSLSALLITGYVVSMAQALRDRDKLLNQLREEDLRDEQIMAVATLAAGTAHELGTPLSTMRILLDELKAEYPDNELLANDLAILSRQLDNCRDTLKKLVATADHKRLGQPGRYQAYHYFRELLDDWRIIHPEAVFKLRLAPELEHYALTGDATLKQALINLLNNAYEASPTGFAVAIYPEASNIILQILDEGPGLPSEIIEQLGRPVIHNSKQGLGIGLLLTHATLTRYGGDVTLYNREQGGTRTRAKLPATRSTEQYD